jgi:hypothetical protein
MSRFPNIFRLSQTSGVLEVPALSGVSVFSGHSQPFDRSSFRCSSEIPAPEFRLFDVPAFPDVSDFSVASTLLVGIPSALLAGIDLPVGKSSALPADIDPSVGIDSFGQLRL